MRARALTMTWLLATAGCTLISGASDLTFQETAPGIVGTKPDGGLGTTTTDAGKGPVVTGSGAGDGGDSGSGSEDSGTPSTRIKNITFENGTLVHALTGADSATGTPQITSNNPIAGSYSMLTQGTTHYGSQSIASAPELFVRVSVRIVNVGGGPSNIHTGRAVFAGGEDVEIGAQGIPPKLSIFSKKGTKGGDFTFSTVGLTLDVGMHVRSTISSTTVELYALAGSGPFGAATATEEISPSLGNVTRVDFGGLSGGNLDLAFDNIRIDTKAMP